jgi:hypothetical protein
MDQNPLPRGSSQVRDRPGQPRMTVTELAKTTVAVEAEYPAHPSGAMIVVQMLRVRAAADRADPALLGEKLVESPSARRRSAGAGGTPGSRRRAAVRSPSRQARFAASVSPGERLRGNPQAPSRRSRAPAVSSGTSLRAPISASFSRLELTFAQVEARLQLPRSPLAVELLTDRPQRDSVCSCRIGDEPNKAVILPFVHTPDKFSAFSPARSRSRRAGRRSVIRRAARPPRGWPGVTSSISSACRDLPDCD